MSGRLSSPLSSPQARVVRRFVHGQTVMDLGAGDLKMALTLVDLGEHRVIAVDRHPLPDSPDSRVQGLQSYFHNLTERAKVVLASWIVNWRCGIVDILADAEIIIYLGKNTDGSACGYDMMWNHLRSREILAHVPDRKNTLTVYGPRVVVRPLTGEEIAFLHDHTVLSFEHAEHESKFNHGTEKQT